MSLQGYSSNSDERASDELPFQEADPVGLGEVQSSHFSIRDYVFKSRSYDVKTNWPFPQKFLQVCLKHGVQDLLPPFELSSTVRVRCPRKRVEPEQVAACSEAEQISAEFQALDIKDSSPLTVELGRIKHVPTDESVIRCPNQIPHQSILDDKLIHSEAESRLPGKLEILHQTPIEDIAKTYMGSKVCPVCKTFTSTSNTTLNAHIDQCLSMDSNTKMALTTSSKIKVRLRKKRMVLDIYATAPRFTLEDLDRRNGTNWAVELVLPAEQGEAYIEAKRPKMSPIDCIDAGDEGEVYVDSNGMKLRVLSKPGDAPQDMLMKNKARKSYITGKRKGFKRKQTKYMKVSPQFKKLSSIKPFKGEVQAERGECLEDMYRAEKESPKHSGLGETVVSTLNPTLEDNDTEIAKSSVARSHILKLAASVEDFSTSLKTKRVHILPNTASMVCILSSNSNPNESTTLGKDAMLKTARSSVCSTSSLRSKRERIHMGTMKNINTLSILGKMASSTSSYPPAKANKSPAKRNVPSGKLFYTKGNKSYKSQKILNAKKFRRHRSLIGIGKRGLVPQSHVEALILDSGTANSKGGICHSNFSENDQLSDSRSNIGASDAANRSVAFNVSKRLECCCPGTGTINVQVEALTDLNSVNIPLEKDIAISSIETPFSKNIEPSFEAQVVEPPVQSFIDEQNTINGDVRNDEIINQSSQKADEVESKEDSCEVQFVPCGTSTVWTQESCSCLEKIRQKSSSIVSSKVMISSKDHCFETEKKSFGSPASSTSTISHPSPENHEFRDLWEECLVRPAVVQDKLSPSLPNIKAIPSLTSTRGTERQMERNKQEVKKGDNFADGVLCYFSHIGRLAHEPQLSSQSFMDGMLLPLKGKQMSSTSSIKSSILSTSDVCPTLGSDNRLHTKSVVTNASPHSVLASPFSQAQSQASSSPILRLMGKNLVVKKDASSVEIPKVAPPESHNSENRKRLSFGYPSTESVSYWNGYSYHQQQVPGGLPFISSTPSKGTTTCSNLKSNEPFWHSNQERMIKKPVHSSLHSSYMAGEVLATDDCPQLNIEHKGSTAATSIMLQRSLPGLPSQAIFVPGEAPYLVRPFVPVPRSRASANLINQGSTPGGSVPLVQSPFIFPTVYHSPAS